MLPLVALVSMMNAPTGTVLSLWPTGNPDHWSRSDVEITEHDKNANFDLVRNVSNPTLEILPVSNAKPGTPTIIVCPGGGYSIEAIQHEGTEIAARLNADGFNAAILKYRLPNREVDKPLHKAPLQDAQRAIRLIRANAAKFHLDPNRVGIMGFSAGGHLAAVTSTTLESTYKSVDDADTQSFRPNFTVLVYPAYIETNGQPITPSEIHVTPETPPAFIVQTIDDPYALSALTYAVACQKAKVPAELHLFPKGGHGYGLRSKDTGISNWMNLLEDWLKDR